MTRKRAGRILRVLRVREAELERAAEQMRRSLRTEQQARAEAAALRRCIDDAARSLENRARRGAPGHLLRVAAAGLTARERALTDQEARVAQLAQETGRARLRLRSARQRAEGLRRLQARLQRALRAQDARREQREIDEAGLRAHGLGEARP